MWISSKCILWTKSNDLKTVIVLTSRLHDLRRPVNRQPGFRSGLVGLVWVWVWVWFGFGFGFGLVWFGLVVLSLLPFVFPLCLCACFS